MVTLQPEKEQQQVAESSHDFLSEKKFVANEDDCTKNEINDKREKINGCVINGDAKETTREIEIFLKNERINYTDEKEISLREKVRNSKDQEANCRRISHSDKDSISYDSNGESYRIYEEASQSSRNSYNNNDKDNDIYLAEKEEEETEESDEEGFKNNDEWRSKKVVTKMMQHEACFDKKNVQVVQQLVPSLDESSFGDVNVTKSKHVHIGNTNFYKGPVTIKQFVYKNSYPVQDKHEDSVKNCIDDIHTGRKSDINTNNLPNVKEHPARPILNNDYDKVTRWLWTWRCAAILCSMALSSITVAVVVIVILTKDGNPALTSDRPETPTSGTNPDDVWINSVRFVERNEWIAQPPASKLSNLTQVPVPYVIISHTATEPCETQGDCMFRVRIIQMFHMESRHWEDIGYNFLVGGDGLAYVGRGWDAEGAHTLGWNKNSIGLSFIGTFNDVVPPNKQLYAASKVIELGVKLGKISPNYKLFGHRQVSVTLSPGDKLYNILKTWDHWSPNP